jgi:Fic family protein
LDLSWDLMHKINAIERFGGSWESIEKKEAQNLKQLKSIATVRSVGASTRIEGSLLSDAEVEQILSSIAVQKFTDRDSQEVAGYYETMELITSSFEEISVSENSIKDLHKRILKYSEKDEWHRGDYKKHPNHVEARMPDGSRRLIFRTTPPGYETDDAMESLIEWYKVDQQTHSLIRIAAFVYEILSIHPFQDGNGRLSRLLATLLLMKEGFGWIQYISFEHEIENRKTAYYSTLRACQSQRPNEDISMWLHFFLDCLIHLQQSLQNKLKSAGNEQSLSSREKSILFIIRERAGIQSGEISTRSNIPLPTVKRILSRLVASGLIIKEGVGRGISYKA